MGCGPARLVATWPRLTPLIIVLPAAAQPSPARYQQPGAEAPRSATCRARPLQPSPGSAASREAQLPGAGRGGEDGRDAVSVAEPSRGRAVDSQAVK